MTDLEEVVLVRRVEDMQRAKRRIKKKRVLLSKEEQESNNKNIIEDISPFPKNYTIHDKKVKEKHPIPRPFGDHTFTITKQKLDEATHYVKTQVPNGSTKSNGEKKKQEAVEGNGMGNKINHAHVQNFKTDMFKDTSVPRESEHLMKKEVLKDNDANVAAVKKDKTNRQKNGKNKRDKSSNGSKPKTESKEKVVKRGVTNLEKEISADTSREKATIPAVSVIKDKESIPTSKKDISIPVVGETKNKTSKPSTEKDGCSVSEPVAQAVEKETSKANDIKKDVLNTVKKETPTDTKKDVSNINKVQSDTIPIQNTKTEISNIKPIKKDTTKLPAQDINKSTPVEASEKNVSKTDVPIITSAKLPATALLDNNEGKLEIASSLVQREFNRTYNSPTETMKTTAPTIDVKNNKDNDIKKTTTTTSDSNDSKTGRPLSYPAYQRSTDEGVHNIKDVPSNLTPKIYSRNGSVDSSQSTARKNVFGPLPSSHNRVNSLDFLHKPQRVTKMNDEVFSFEELQRNTNMNKKIIIDSAFPFDKPNYEDVTKDGLSAEQTPVSHTPESNNEKLDFQKRYKSQEERTDAIIEMTQDDSISPTEKSYPVLNKADQSTSTIANKNNIGTFDDPYETLPVEDHMMPLPPVYKKSGELVKSSLKRRSKSLPVTPNSNSRLNLKNSNGNDNIHTNLTRSKSVHFDQRLPVKYFFKEESPNVVSYRDEEDDVLSFQHKPLQRSVDVRQGKKRLDLSRHLEDGFGDNDLDMLIDDDLDDDDDDGEGGFGDGNTIFSRGLKSLMINDSNSLKNNFKDPPAQKKENKTREKTFGIHNKNFPILGNKNPRSLKLNIFSNSSQDKKVFLQEVSLNVQQRKNNFYNNTQYSTFTNDDNPENDEKLIITGSILVKNIYFSKKVLVRYTWNHWRTSSEVESMYVGSGNSYLPGSNMDIFRFMIDNTVLANGQYVSNKSNELEFCICYITRANDDSSREEYWDNNNNKNYIIEMQKRSA